MYSAMCVMCVPTHTSQPWSLFCFCTVRSKIERAVNWNWSNKKWREEMIDDSFLLSFYFVTMMLVAWEKVERKILTCTIGLLLVWYYWCSLSVEVQWVSVIILVTRLVVIGQLSRIGFGSGHPTRPKLHK